jgi:protein TonB
MSHALAELELATAPPRRRAPLRALMALLALAFLALAGWLAWKLVTAGPGAEKPRVQQVSVIRQPPPPPPKPPERPPEPPKLREEVPIDAPQPTPQAQPQPAAEAPAAGPLGVDATGSGGGDAFGLAGRPGGRDLLQGGGGGGAYYTGLLQRHFFEALSRNRSILRDEFRVVVRIWLGDDGRVTRAEIVAGSGDAQVDAQIQATLMDITPLRDVPPPSMRPMQLRLSNRS